MARSPSRSSPRSSFSSSPKEELLLLQQQETDDDSGVDVKPQEALGRRYHRQEELELELEESVDNKAQRQRNKRKSSEPKRRKDVLLMKRFRGWDTDEEDAGGEFEEEDEEPFEEDVQRPGSGDSGCPTEAEPPAQGGAKKGRRRPWRKPPIKEEPDEEEEESVPAFRQSVICKNETTTSSCTHLLHQHNDPPGATSSHSGAAKPRPAGGAGDYGSVAECPRARGDESEEGPSRTSSGGVRPRNYKSMSRQRRIEANARERTRVHTISAAFESLRRAVPAYAHNQKLSKLAILRIASAYILALACLNGGGNSAPEQCPEEQASSMSECVERCTRTIQAEGRSRRRTSKE